MEQINNELQHHGVKGMKWGQRKAKHINNGTARKKAKNAAKESFAKDKKELSGIGSGRKALKNARKAYKNSVTKSKGRKPIDDYKEYQKKQRDAGKLRMTGIGAKAASFALGTIGKSTYRTFKNNGSPAAAAVVNGSMIASKALDLYGNIAITAGTIQRIRNWADYARS